VSELQQHAPQVLELPLYHVLGMESPRYLRYLASSGGEPRIVVTGLGPERYAVPLEHLSVRMPARQAVELIARRPMGDVEGPDNERLAARMAEVLETERQALVPGNVTGEEEAAMEAACNRAYAPSAPSASLHVPTAAAPEPSRRQYPIPSVTYLEAEQPHQGITIVHDNRIIAAPCTMLDTGANVNLITADLAHRLNLSHAPSHSITLAGTSDTPTATVGRITSPISIGLCVGTTAACLLSLPIHVVPSTKQQRWGLLLGTGFLSIIGARLDFFSSELLFRPNLADSTAAPTESLHSLQARQDPAGEVFAIPMITTTSNPSPSYLADLTAPTAACR
jgi:hypothetical protein